MSESDGYIIPSVTNDLPRMQRFNTHKPPITMVPTAFISYLTSDNFNDLDTILLEDTARVLDYGSRKYARDNWRKGGPWMEVLDCALRHLDKIIRKETHDDESGIHHGAHVACNLAFLAEFIDEKKGEDNRYHMRNATDGILVQATGVGLIYANLLRWKDGGDNRYFYDAIKALSTWYSSLPDSERELRPGSSPYAYNTTTIQPGQITIGKLVSDGTLSN